MAYNMNLNLWQNTHGMVGRLSDMFVYISIIFDNIRYATQTTRLLRLHSIDYIAVCVF